MPALSPIIAEAKALGRKTYFTGVPCKRGHIAERYTATRTCVTCSTNHRAENLQTRLENEARWREKHRVVANARTAAWVQKYPERQRQAEINYRQNNPDKRKVSCSQYRAANPEKEAAYAKEWRNNNKPLLAAKTSARRAAKLKATPPWANGDAIKAIYEEAARLTRETGAQWDVDHIHPLVHDLICGLHCEANLRPITARENRSKCNRVPPETFEPVAIPIVPGFD